MKKKKTKILFRCPNYKKKKKQFGAVADIYITKRFW